MNIRSEVRLEIIRDNLTFSCCLPANATHDIALEVFEEFKASVEQMKKAAEEQKKSSQPTE